MDFIRSASGKSIWRGYYYYDENRATVTRRVSATIIQGTVSGSSANLYSVEIDLAHPKRSKCDCPFADGKQIICKVSTATGCLLRKQKARTTAIHSSTSFRSGRTNTDWNAVCSSFPAPSHRGRVMDDSIPRHGRQLLALFATGSGMKNLRYSTTPTMSIPALSIWPWKVC